MPRLLATSMAACLLAGCSAPSPADSLGFVHEPIAGGELDQEHREVFELITHFGGGGVSICTATLIAPNLLLTARHCVANGTRRNIVCGSSPFESPVPAGNVAATSAAVPTQTSVYYEGAAIEVPETGNDNCGFDIALVVLARNVSESVARPAIPRIDREARAGEPYVAIGYGLDDAGNPTAGRMLLDGLAVQCAAADCSGFGVTETEFMGAPGVCSGDSGGPALDPERRVIGVLSRGSDPCETPVYGSVAGFRDWITNVAFEAAEAGNYEPPFWAFSGSSDPPPGGVGDRCESGSECVEGTVCYYESDPSDAHCTSICAERADCEAPAVCRQGFDVPGGGLCLAPRGPLEPRAATPPSDSCAVRSPGSASPAAGAMGVALSLLFLLRRRASVGSRPRRLVNPSPRRLGRRR